VFLILDQVPADFSLRLKRVADRKGVETLFLTSAEIVRSSALVFYVSTHDVHLRLRVQDRTVELPDLDGVYCGINTFEPGLWEWFSPEDAEYAAKETQALWLAILASLPCRVVNPPALDTLAGTLLFWPELLYLAHRLGFHIPMVITLESGSVAAELLTSGVPARYACLGESRIREASFRPEDVSSLAQRQDHILVKEEVPGRPVYVTLVGGRTFACAPDAGGSAHPVPASDIPRQIRTRLRTLHRQLNLNLAEYAFRVMADGTWVFAGCGRPPVFAVAAYGDALFAQIVDFAMAAGG